MEESKKSTDDGQPTNDDSGLNKEQPGNNKIFNENISITNHIAESGEHLTHNSHFLTSDMEVHHHPNPHHKTKKIKEYFLEFLMIFLAVTLGFFAESYREQLVERKREKEYMKEIVQNLEYDSLRCNLNVQTNDQVIAGMDSLRTELKKAIRGTINANAIYYFSLQYAGNVGHAVFNTSAITELKNSGSLRLIENKELVNALADYYERKLIAAETFLPNRSQVSALQKTQNEILSLLDMDDYISSFAHFDEKKYAPDYDYKRILEHEPALQLLKSDSISLEHFYTEIGQFEIQIMNYNFWLGFDKKAAEKLIAEIKKEYHLE